MLINSEIDKYVLERECSQAKAWSIASKAQRQHMLLLWSNSAAQLIAS